jgi:type VI secretion system protein ImpK
MSNGGGDEHNPNRTVFRPSPLKGLRDQQAPAAAPGPAPSGWGPAPAPAAAPRFEPSPPPLPQAEPEPAVAAERLADDDIPPGPLAQSRRNLVMSRSAPLLALAASIRSGRARMPLPQLHARTSALIAEIDKALAGAYPEPQRQRAKYALCATIDDIAQNLPGDARDGAEWARRSLTVQFFQENIGGDRFWQLVDDMLTKPGEYSDMIELYHACLAAGFEGRFRVMSDGKRRLHEIMTRLYAALEHARSLSAVELSPQWRGAPTPPPKVGFWSILAMAGGVALALLVVVFLLFRLILLQTGQPAMQALRGVLPEQPLRLSRAAPAPPQPPSDQAATLARFLAPEIAQHLVTVDSDASTVRVRTTVGQLFKPGSDQLDPGREALFNRIAAGVETQPGAVKVEGYTDSDPLKTLTFPDNVALSEARARTVAALLQKGLSQPNRVSAVGFGASRPIASNATADGKAQNRRVEVVIPRVR